MEAHQDTSALNVRMSAVENAVIRISDDVAGLRKQFVEGRSTQWPLLISLASLLFVVVSGLGFITLQPVKEKTTEMSQDLRALVREQLVPRAELNERWEGNKRDLINLRERIVLESGDLQRQVNDIRAQYGNIFNVRDIIQGMLTKIDKLESEIGKKG